MFWSSFGQVLVKFWSSFGHGFRKMPSFSLMLMDTFDDDYEALRLQEDVDLLAISCALYYFRRSIRNRWRRCSHWPLFSVTLCVPWGPLWHPGLAVEVHFRLLDITWRVLRFKLPMQVHGRVCCTMKLIPPLVTSRRYVGLVDFIHVGYCLYFLIRWYRSPCIVFPAVFFFCSCRYSWVKRVSRSLSISKLSCSRTNTSHSAARHLTLVAEINEPGRYLRYERCSFVLPCSHAPWH